MTKKVFIITGEYSGDKHASEVVKYLKELAPDTIIEGVGESNLEKQGVKLLFNHEKMGKMGLTVSSIINHIQLGKRIISYLKDEFKPDLVILIDYGAFNLQISKELKKLKIKTFYFIPPQIWASRKWRLKTIKKNIDKVLTIFPFEKKFYDEAGINSTFVGHPIISELPECKDREKFFLKHNLDPSKKLVSVFPGSRTFEIKHLLKIFLKTIELIKNKRSDVQFVFSHAPSLKDDAFKVPYKTIKNENYELLAYSDALILTSGTVALEAALYETPMLIAYRGPIFFYLVYLLLRNIKRACLVNIITGCDYIDEFLMFDANPKKIALGLNQILDNKEKKEHILQGCRKVKELLSGNNATKKAAEVISEELSD